MNKQRESNIELLKIIAIFLIAIAHSVPTYGDIGNPYYIEVKDVSNSVSHFLVTFFWYFGMLGNSLFIVATSWFLQNDNKIKIGKIARIIFDLLFFSILILIFFFLTRNILNWPLNLNSIVRQFFPLLFNNNWFITCYLLLYIVHPFLNLIIHQSDEVQFGFTLMLGLLVSCAQFLLRESYYYNDFLGFCYIYLIVGYIRIYKRNLIGNIKTNLIGITGSLSLLLILLLVTNFVGLKISFLSSSMCRWRTLTNPLIIVFAICFFNLLKLRCFHSRIINFIASSALYIYLIHENYLVKTLLKPKIWEKIYFSYGYRYVALFVLVFAIISFCICFIVYITYRGLLQKRIYRIIDMIIK